MKKATFLTCFLISYFFVSAQKLPLADSGYYNPTTENGECVTPQHRKAIIETLQRNVARLKTQGKLSYNSNLKVPTPLLIWPVRQIEGLPYKQAWAISNYVDHNQEFPNKLTDYNCGGKTYDTSSGYNHQGLDIFTFPFTMKLMDDNAVEVIAATGGQIIAKQDNQFDRNCSFNNNPWNAVYIQHNDGSVAWYGHLKKGSATTKNVGDMVEQGEYLGVVGSSGNSTGPHLHFELWTDNTYTKNIDPYSGNCNNLNTESWWADQKPYLISGVNAALTHTDIPSVYNCPETLDTYESNDFGTTDKIHILAYLRDTVENTDMNLRVIKPDNSELYNWNNTVVNGFPSAWYRWELENLTDQGEWTWEVTYGGETVQHKFNVGTLSIQDKSLKSTQLYPNPTNGELKIFNGNVNSISLIDVTGKTILTKHRDTNIKSIDISKINRGFYFVKLENNRGENKVVKILKQ